ncbi:MAG: thioredoxin domain-containing protein [Pseudomonadales bacterium]
MPNRLSAETSPYLLQHADNPVDWHPWNDEALALARQSGKPILLSVGYSACHWCHVMAHESFEDPHSAALMNELYVNIKVDREERPDLDKVYQIAHHLLTQQPGGWPLTMFLDPQTLVPFFGGTYFPKAAQQQMPGFTDVLQRVHEAFNSNKAELDQQGEKMLSVLAALSPDPTAGAAEDREILQQATQALQSQFDAQHGGFGNAPKFPMPTTVTRLLEDWAQNKHRGDHNAARPALDMVMTSLTQMARGGIFDHLGGGFCRYSVDARWMIPHFEKMLYDNGQLLSLYADALRVGPDALFSATLHDTAQWLLREMCSAEGAFYSALDADSEGEEGKYYVWRRDRVRKLLSEDEYLIVETLYGLDKPANFEGSWHLHRYDSWPSVVQRLSMQRESADALLASAREKLLRARTERIAPAMDDKVLTSWNALAAKGLAKAGAVSKRDSYIEAAQRTIDWLQANVWDGATLFATWKQQPKYAGYLDDYANLLDALITLLQVRWRGSDLQFATEIADALIEQFYDIDQGGFFFTAKDQQGLIYRPKPTMDDALPPGNGVAAQALLKLGHLLGEVRYLDAAAGTLRWARSSIEQYPAGHCTLLSALSMEANGLSQILIHGTAEEAAQWRAAVDDQYLPWRQTYVIPIDAEGALPAYLPTLRDVGVVPKTTAYVCENLSCSAPITELEALQSQLTQV